LNTYFDKLLKEEKKMISLGGREKEGKYNENLVIGLKEWK
jgi:hypothetical protein